MKTKIFKVLILIYLVAMNVTVGNSQCTSQCAADAGSDKTICCPGASVTIGAANCKCTIHNNTPKTCSEICPGTTYSWSPATGLSSTTVCNPIASPTVTTTYTLTVTFGSRCCCDGASGNCANDTCSGVTRTDQVTVTVNNACCFKPRDENICGGIGTY